MENTNTKEHYQQSVFRKDYVHRGSVLPVINMADKMAAHGVNDVCTN